MIKPAALFSDHAIVQSGRPVPVWGHTLPRQRVRVVLGPHSGLGFSSAHGRFLVWLPELPAGGPYRLEISLPDHPEMPPAVANDLLAGEVWLASGQSNMEWTLTDCDDPVLQSPGIEDPELRVFTVARRADLAPQDEVDGQWRLSNTRHLGAFPAAAWHCAARLRRELRVPVGVIVSAWGGSPLEAWLSRQGHARNPHLSAPSAKGLIFMHSEERWQMMEVADPDGSISAMPADTERLEAAASWHEPDFDDSAWPRMRLPSTWQVHGHDHSGVLWFRRAVRIPESWAGQELRLEIGAADKHDITYVNGHEVGRTGKHHEEQHWNVPRVYPVPAGLTGKDELHIAVRVFSFIYDGGLIGPASRMRISCPEFPEEAPVPLDGEWSYAIEHDFGLITTPHTPGHLCHDSPAILYENMIAPLAPYPLRGAMWYQGERNADRADRYASMLRDMIEDWRQLWGTEKLPFLIVQLPLFREPLEHQPQSTWAHLREAQLQVAQSVPDTALAVVLDVGEADNIHPSDKATVGHRLAQAALARVYGKVLVAGGPLPEKAWREGSGVRVSFTDAGTGLTTLDGLPPQPVFLCDTSGTWHRAVATIEEDQLIVTSPNCAEPESIAYAWADNPAGANLANLDGFPASPFRLDVSSI